MMQVVLEELDLIGRVSSLESRRASNKKRKRKDADSENFPASVLRMVYIEKRAF